MIEIEVETCLKTVKDKGPGWERADRRYFTKKFLVDAPEVEKYIAAKYHPLTAINMGEEVEYIRIKGVK